MNRPTAAVPPGTRTPEHPPRMTARPSQLPALGNGILDGLADVLVGVLCHSPNILPRARPVRTATGGPSRRSRNAVGCAPADRRAPLADKDTRDRPCESN